VAGLRPVRPVRRSPEASGLIGLTGLTGLTGLKTRPEFHVKISNAFKSKDPALA